MGGKTRALAVVVCFGALGVAAARSWVDGGREERRHRYHRSSHIVSFEKGVHERRAAVREARNAKRSKIHVRLGSGEGADGDGNDIRFRSRSAPPLILVDGIRLDLDPEEGAGAGRLLLEDIVPSAKIKSVIAISGGSALEHSLEQYGKDAENGVVLISTELGKGSDGR